MNSQLNKVPEAVESMPIEIIIDEKADNFLKKKEILSILLEVQYIEQPCVQIFNPIIKSMQDNISKSGKLVGQTKTLKVSASEKFLERFTLPKKLILSSSGFIKKELIVKNIEPIIKNVCKF